MTDTQKFSLGFYFQVMSRMLGNPREFFSDLSPDTEMMPPLLFLTVSSLIFAVSGVMNGPSAPALTGSILFVNAVGMVFISSGLGYMVIFMTQGKRFPFRRIFAIYAFSSGLTLLASWIPFFLVITEPWKWWLIGTGMTCHLSLNWKQALAVVLLSVGIILLFFWSLIPLLAAVNR
ncbi:MAG: YIP1 family protein [Desulfococcaceae bacterium]|jgi:hypothetical protein|nr:YIP1 family protein [Desulfococcaceae bacterium]